VHFIESPLSAAQLPYLFISKPTFVAPSARSQSVICMSDLCLRRLESLDLNHTTPLATAHLARGAEGDPLAVCAEEGNSGCTPVRGS